MHNTDLDHHNLNQNPQTPVGLNSHPSKDGSVINMASFWVESIRTAAVGTLALSGSYAFYRHSISSNTSHVQFIQDKNIVGVRLPPMDPAVEKVMHNTQCLTNVKHYKVLSKTDREVYFEKPPATLDVNFKADCKECGAGSVILYDKHERDPAFEYISWTI